MACAKAFPFSLSSSLIFTISLFLSLYLAFKQKDVQPYFTALHAHMQHILQQSNYSVTPVPCLMLLTKHFYSVNMTTIFTRP